MTASPTASHYVGPEEPRQLDDWTLEVSGLVGNEMRLSADDIQALAAQEGIESPIVCPDGAVATSGSLYQGLPLDLLLEAAQPTAAATHVNVHSGPYVATFQLDSVERRGAILALERNGHRMSWAEGGPIRLVAAKGACFDGVKWVERITLTADGSSATAVSIIKARRAAMANADSE